MYADDITLLAESESDLQKMLDMVNLWCHRWRMAVNQNKTQVVHFRKKGVNQSSTVFNLGSANLVYVGEYKYLGFIFDEFMSYEAGMQSLADSAGRALGSVINKMKVVREMGHKTYTQLYNACISPILSYAAGVWGGREAKVIDNIENRAIRCVLGVHKFAAIPAIQGDMGWTS